MWWDMGGPPAEGFYSMTSVVVLDGRYGTVSVSLPALTVGSASPLPTDAWIVTDPQASVVTVRVMCAFSITSAFTDAA